MVETILSMLATVLVPVLKLIFEWRAGKKLTDKEFAEVLEAHQKQRANAGQTVFDWRDSVAKLKDSVAKKKDDSSSKEG